jgi:nucleoside-diphosphate kinase
MHLTTTDLERTLFLVKPNALCARVGGQILHRLENEGFTIINLVHTQASRELIEQHYAEHKNYDYFENTCKVTASGPLWKLVLERENAVAHARAILGSTMSAAPGTIRGNLGPGATTADNWAHASDTWENAGRELDLWFPNSVVPHGFSSYTDYYQHRRLAARWVKEGWRVEDYNVSSTHHAVYELISPDDEYFRVMITGNGESRLMLEGKTETYTSPEFRERESRVPFSMAPHGHIMLSWIRQHNPALTPA